MIKNASVGGAIVKVGCLSTAVWLASCTALDTSSVALDPSSVGTQNMSQQKPRRVGRYYLLPKALITIEGAPDKDGNLLIDSSVALVADSRFRYFLYWRPNVFSEDIFKNIDVDSDGMLTSINYSAEDKTPQILSDLVTTTVNIAKIARDLGAGLEVVKKYPPFTYTFDPFDSVEVNRVERDLRTQEKLELRISPPPAGIRSEIARSINPRVGYHDRAEDPPGGGVFYHPPTTVEMLLIDHNAEEAASKAKTVKQQETAAVAAAVAAMEQEKRNAAAAAVSPAGGGGAEASPTPTPKKTPAAPAIDKTQPTPKPATLCHVVVTVPDVDQVACLPLGRSFLTKRESNLGFAHGMPTTLVFKQPSGVQAFTGTLSSISGIVAAAVPTLIGVKSTSTAAPAAAAAPAAVAEGKTEGARAGGKTTTSTAQNAALSVEQTPPASDQDLQATIDQLKGTIGRDTQTMQKLRDLLITQLKARGVSDDEINKILVSNGFLRMP